MTIEAAGVKRRHDPAGHGMITGGPGAFRSMDIGRPTAPSQPAASSATGSPRSPMRRMLNALNRRLESVLLSSLAREVRRRHLTYLTPRKLRALETTLRHVRRAGVPGDFLEFGVALGGSAVVIASHAGGGRSFHGYDVFDMIPPPGPEDGERAHRRYAEIRSGRSGGLGGDVYYGYIDDLYARVCHTFADFGLPVDNQRVILHRGRFEQTLHASERRPVAFAHIDCDWHEPVTYCLETILHRLAPGACVIFDDYNDYGGCRKAVDSFLAEHDDIRLLTPAPSAIIERLPRGDGDGSRA